MQIFLLILKVLGILILCILGILILLISLILFVPVRYQIEGEIEENFKFRIKGKMSWLLSVLTVRFSYMESELWNEIRILGFKYKKREIQQENEISEDVFEEASGMNDAKAETEDVGPEITYHGKTLLKKESEKTKEERKVPESESSAASEDKKAHDEKKRKTSWFQKLIDKIKSFFTELKQKIINFIELLKNGKEKISDIKELISDETNKKAVSLLWKEMKYLLHHFRFRKIETDLCFGTDDPAATGQILGVLCLFPVLYQYKFHLYPDFEAEKLYLKGTFKIAGKVRMIHLLTSLVRLIREKEVRTFIKNRQIRSERER